MSAQEALDSAYHQLVKLRRTLKKSKTRQVSATEERQLVISTAHAWFNGSLPSVTTGVAPDGLGEINAGYRAMLGFADRQTSRTRYDALLKDLANSLSVLRRDVVSGVAPAPLESTDDPPAFDQIAGDLKMREILRRRWIECAVCVSAGAPLAATVMMGGMLESLFVARANMELEKSKIFASAHAPVDHKTKKKLPLQHWTLKNYIDVALDLGWITQSVKDIGEVIRDYRNYVHPHKEYSHNTRLAVDDAEMFWEITKKMTRQLLDRV